MHVRSAIAVLAGTGALVATVGLAPVAQADTTDPVTCTVTGITPSSFTLGVTTQPVQFGVQTSCDGTYPVLWDMSSEITQGSSGFSWLLLRNYHVGGEKFTHVESADGWDPLNFVTGLGGFQGNKMAGPHKVGASAFYDADGNGRQNNDETRTSLSATVIAKRETSFTDLQLSSSERKAGKKIWISSNLQRANWDTGTVDGFAAPVELQFRADGHHHWHDVKSVDSDGTSATTSVRATTSGSYRYRYLGDDVSGVAYSASAHVTVYTPHHHRHH